MSQDEFSTEARRYTQGKTNKEGTTRSGATAPTERHKAPARQQSTTHKGSKTKSPFCVVLKIYHLNTWILHKTCLKHSNFLNRKILRTWNIMATAMGQGTEETQRVETRFKIQQFQHLKKDSIVLVALVRSSSFVLIKPYWREVVFLIVLLKVGPSLSPRLLTLITLGGLFDHLMHFVH